MAKKKGKDLAVGDRLVMDESAGNQRITKKLKRRKDPASDPRGGDVYIMEDAEGYERAIRLHPEKEWEVT